MNEFMENGTQEQIEKLRACKTAEELLALTKEFRIDLDKAQAEEMETLFRASNGEITDEALELVTGGHHRFLLARKHLDLNTCKFCGGNNVAFRSERSTSGQIKYLFCSDCKQSFDPYNS
jgi:hypothetical protein